MKPYALLLVLIPSLLCSSKALAQPRLELLTDAIQQPMYVTHAGDTRLFIVERTGRVWIHENGALLPTPYLDISSQVSIIGEGAVTSIAFHPDYTQNGRMFVFFSEPNVGPGQVLVVARFTASATDANRADPDSRRDLLRLPKSTTNHHGGQLQFGPDGFLYVSFGDASDLGHHDPACNGQNPEQLFGKLLRLDVDLANDAAPWYEIPPTNPFADPFDGVADETWALGFRNPFRFSFDRSSGALWLGDVGDFVREEIDFQPASSPGGENYGWKVLEGTFCRLPGNPVGGSCPLATPPCDDPVYAPPVFEYENPLESFVAVIGGHVYRGSESPAFQGRYVFADFASVPSIQALRERTPPYTAEALPVQGLGSPVAIGEDRDGELYVADVFANKVWRLRLGAAPVTPDARCIVKTNTATAKLATAAARDVRACALAGAKDRLAGSVEGCILDDHSGALAKSSARLAEMAADFCQDEQPFGFVAAAAATSAATTSERELAHAVFGPDLDVALADASEERSRHLCQRNVQRALAACQKTRRAEYLRCQKLGLRDGSVSSLAGLAACLDADPNDRIDRICEGPGGRLTRTISRSCAGVGLDAAFPGCASALPGELAACLDRVGRCRHCRLFDAADALGVNCELYDDAAMNASCGPLE